MIIHIQVFGRVQGVGFRAWAVRQGEDLNLSGWVRNRINGSVEILAEGDPMATDSFLQKCRRGAFFSRVDRIVAINQPDAPIPPIQPGIFCVQATV